MFTETVESVDEGLARLLTATRSGELTAARLKDLIAASRSWEAKVTALQTDAARLIAQQERHGDGGASVLRDQAGKTKYQARRSLGTAEALDEMSGLRAAVDAGEVSLANAERLADAAQRTGTEAVDSDSDLLAMARELPPDRFAREAAAWAQRHQPDHGHGDWLAKRRQRYLKTWKQQDGMVRLDGLLDPETGARIGNRLQSAAEELRRQDQQAARTGDGPDGSEDFTTSGGSGDGPSSGGEMLRSWDQLRADALDLLTSGAADGSKARGESGGRPKAEIIVVADIGTLTGDNPAGRCEIPGIGPVPPAVLERIACDAHLTGLLFADGKPLHHGSTVRTATAKQWRALIARDRGCVGCGTQPARCQAHHIIPWAQSRRTDIDNLVLVCWKCHHNIHDHHWRITHRNGKPALEPPNPQTPPHPANGQHPCDQNPHEPRRPRPSPNPQTQRPRAGPGPNRQDQATRPDNPDPPRQTAAALFPA